MSFRTRLPTVVRLLSYPDLWVPFGFQFTSPFERFLEDVAIKRADAVFAPSTWVAAYVQAKLNRPVAVVESPFVPPQDLPDASVWAHHLRSRERYGSDLALSPSGRASLYLPMP